MSCYADFKYRLQNLLLVKIDDYFPCQIENTSIEVKLIGEYIVDISLFYDSKCISNMFLRSIMVNKGIGY